MRRASRRTHTSEVWSGAPGRLAVPLWRGWAQGGSRPQGCAQALSSHSGGPAPGRRWGGCWWCQARGLQAVLGTTAQPSSIQLVWLDSLKPGGTAPQVTKALQDTCLHTCPLLHRAPPAPRTSGSLILHLSAPTHPVLLQHPVLVLLPGLCSCFWPHQEASGVLVPQSGAEPQLWQGPPES